MFADTGESGISSGISSGAGILVVSTVVENPTPDSYDVPERYNYVFYKDMQSKQ